MNYAIILAAGQGQRMNSKRDKMMLEVAGKPLVYYSLMAYNDHPEIDEIVVVANKDNKEKIKEILNIYHLSKVKKIVLGGATRQASAEKGLSALSSPQDADVVLVHNGANPLPSPEEISETIVRIKEVGAAIVGHKITSTVKEADAGHIVKTHDRERLFAAETPQGATHKVFEIGRAHV